MLSFLLLKWSDGREGGECETPFRIDWIFSRQELTNGLTAIRKVGLHGHAEKLIQ